MSTLIDRTKAPGINDIKTIPVLRVKQYKTDNGVPVYYINAGSQDVLKVELIFKAGFVQQQQALIAATTSNLLDEGTVNRTAVQIADGVDYYGAFLETSVAHETATVSLFTLKKHLNKLLPVLEDVIKNAIFPEEELELNLQNKKQKYLVNKQKVSAQARKKFSEMLFGSTHPFGYYIKEEDFDKVKKPLLEEFYKKYYHSGNVMILISGKVDEAVLKEVNKVFGKNVWKEKENRFVLPKYIFSAPEEKRITIEKSDALQSAIRIGRLLVNKKHPDYFALQVLNTVLGGYFGSRLMSNIREDKGYTYGIGSGIVSFQSAGYFFISTEVGVDVCSAAVDEIYKEIKRLREERISESELQLVRNYMLGTFLSSIDGPFALADRFKGIEFYGLDYSYYDNYIQTIKTVSSSALMDLANNYLQEKDLLELVVGKR